MVRHFVVIVLVFVALVASCGSATDAPADSPTPDVTNTAEPTTSPPETGEPDQDSDELFPDVVAAEATQMEDGSFTFAATLSSPYDSPERYADAWRILGPDGTQLGIRELGHDHAGEQPFTRSVSGVEIPADVTTVTIQGRDQVSGWGGDTVDIQLER